MSEQLWTIGQLAATAGVTPRTIRYYTAEGLLPAPVRRGSYAHYDQEHLLRLQLIARLKAAYLPLGEIRVRLDRLTLEQVRSQLELAEGKIGAESVDVGPPQTLHVAAPLRPTIGYKPAVSGASSPRAQLQVGLTSESVISAQQRMVGHASIVSQLVTGARKEHGTFDSTHAESWQRIGLASGIELHLREPLTPAIREQVMRLLEFAHDLFS